jgi:hypothetical protein
LLNVTRSNKNKLQRVEHKFQLEKRQYKSKLFHFPSGGQTRVTEYCFVNLL